MFDFERLLTPSAWFQYGKTDWVWDAELNKYLDTNPQIEYPGVCIVTFPSFSVCIIERSYGALLPMVNYNRNDYRLPSVKTRKRLKEYIKNAL